VTTLKRTCIGLLALALLGLPAAPHSAAAQAGTMTYEVTITNITSGMQVLSPFILATHPASAHLWQMGQAASPGLELLAEEGMPSGLASEVQPAATDVVTTGSPLPPGQSVTLTIKAREGDVLSAASMLVQTNDGFTGLDSAALTTASTDAMAYDAGTEDNTEKKSDVPGPPFGGMNAGPATNPRGVVAPHEGIKGVGDVTPEFNWTGPVARFAVHAMMSTPAATPTSAPEPSMGAAATPTATMPNMPKTGGSGGSDSTPWLPLGFGAALALVLAGLTTRRALAGRR
jgi:hypothetical protein